MRIDSIGITFKYRGIPILYHWPLLQTYFYQSRFIIPLLKFESSSFFKCINKIKEVLSATDSFVRSRIYGFRYSDIAGMAACTYFKNKSGILITDVNVQAKPTQFWEAMPKEYIRHFLNDAIFITCKSPEEVSDLMYHIPQEFGDAVGYHYGVRICDNIEV